MSDFLEKELDRVYEQLVIAQTILALPIELAESNCATITKSLDDKDAKFINSMKVQLPVIKSKISEANILLSKIKQEIE